MSLSNTLVQTRAEDGRAYVFCPIGSTIGVDCWVECRMVVSDDARSDDLGFEVEGWEVAWIDAGPDGQPGRSHTKRFDGDTERARRQAVEMYLMLAHHALNRFERVHSPEWSDLRPGGPNG